MRKTIVEARIGLDDARRRRVRTVRGWMLGVGILASTLVLPACDAQPQAADTPPAPSATEGAARAAPAKTDFADVDGARVHYQVYGDLASGKTPLLILHGSYMTGDGMQPMIEPFAATRPVIAIDQRGHGRTGDLPSPTTMPNRRYRQASSGSRYA